LFAGVVLWPRLHLGDGAFLRDTSLLQALPLVGLALLVAAPAIAAFISPGARGRLVAGAALALFGAATGAGALVVLRHPLIHRDPCPFNSGHATPGLRAAPTRALLPAAGGGLAATIAASIAVSTRAVPPPRIARAAAWSALALGAAVTISAALSAHRR